MSFLPPKAFQDLSDQIHKKALARMKKIYAQREEIIEAFIAKHGCGPDEVLQVEQVKRDGTCTWFVVNRKAWEVRQRLLK